MKKLIAISVLLLFVSVPMGSSLNAEEPPELSEFVNCVSFFSRVLRVRENRCRRWEFEVKVEGNGGGNGGGNGNIMTVTDSANYQDFCVGNENQSLEILLPCPDNKILLGGSCNVSPDIPAFDNPAPPITLNSFERSSGMSNTLDPISGTIGGRYQCGLGCNRPADPEEAEVTGLLTATAICIEP